MYQLWAIIGPTASGKSELAMVLARQIGGEILSVDSMQVYRGMDIGTAKPTPQEQVQVQHHLIDMVDPNESFTVARFVELAQVAITDATRRGVPLIACGGTPLYFKALFEGLFDGPGEDPQLRRRLRALAPEELHRRLAQVDPPAAGRIHQNDVKRLLRALEVYELTGRPISSLQREWEPSRPRLEARWVGLRWEREELNRRINARVKLMIAAGWLDETRALLDRFGTLSLTAMEAAGYAELTEHIRGRRSLDDAIEQIKIRTRQLARRQMKWFKRFAGVLWIPGQLAIEERLRLALEADGCAPKPSD